MGKVAQGKEVLSLVIRTDTVSRTFRTENMRQSACHAEASHARSLAGLKAFRAKQ